MSDTKARGGLETIDIKGKPYVTVAERVKAVTDMEDLDKNRYEIERWERFTIGERDFLTCHILVGKPRYEVKKDDEEAEWLIGGCKRYSGTAQISFTGGMVNTTSGYENAETSALGRALAFAGIGLLEGVASADEINKAHATPAEAPKRIDTDQAAKLLSLAKLKGYTDKAEAVEFLNGIAGEDFTQLDPKNFEAVKAAVSMHDGKEPF